MTPKFSSFVGFFDICIDSTICITQLLVPGFHWGLYFTDERGAATRHEWAEVKRRHDLTLPVESYSVTTIDPVTNTDIDNRMHLAFLKVKGYRDGPSQRDLSSLCLGSSPLAGTLMSAVTAGVV